MSNLNLPNKKKLNIGDEVWYYFDNHPCLCRGIIEEKNNNKCKIKNKWYNISDVYKEQDDGLKVIKEIGKRFLKNKYKDHFNMVKL